MCILKLCGVLEIGPYPYNPMCFDIVTYSNAIDIAMEKCECPQFDHENKKRRESLAKTVEMEIEEGLRR